MAEFPWLNLVRAFSAYVLHGKRVAVDATHKGGDSIDPGEFLESAAFPTNEYRPDNQTKQGITAQEVLDSYAVLPSPDLKQVRPSAASCAMI